MIRAALVGLLALAIQGKPSLDIHYVPTPPKVVDAMLDLAGVTARDVVYDLGSGDGRIVIAAATKYGARGVGIELDPELIQRSNSAARKANVSDKVRFITEDIFKADLSEATVVTLYLSPSTNLRLRERLRRDLRPGTRIVSHRFDMGDWKPEQERQVGDIHVFRWTIGPRD
jgi:SAM-dependent methyltransferase